jgi:hypothetical protein
MNDSELNDSKNSQNLIWIDTKLMYNYFHGLSFHFYVCAVL